MKDKQFLLWLHKRLVNVYGENKDFDYMHKLRSVISTTPPNKETPNTAKEKDTLLEINPYGNYGIQFYATKQEVEDSIKSKKLNGAIYSAIDRNRFSKDIPLEKLEKIAEILNIEI